MARIRQLTNTFQPRQQSVMAPTIRVDALAPGLAEASSSLLAAQQIKLDYKAQKSQAQGERASWEVEDWLNRFTSNMNTPEKLKTAFQSTKYEGIVAGINENIDIYDSSVAQNMYRMALDVAGSGIDDEATRNNWVTSKMREWEAIEPIYQKEADRWIQEDARNTEMSNLHSLWTSGIGTTDPNFIAKQQNMREMGHYGMDPTTSMQAMNAVTLNYQKAEQTALMEDVLGKTLMPYAMQGASQEELNIIMNGLDLSMEGKNYLTQDEKDTITKRYMNHATNYSKLYKQKIEEGHTIWQDMQWQEIMGIKTNQELNDGERIALAQQKVNQLIGMYNSILPPLDTGIKDMPAIELGSPDGKELKRMIDNLNMYVSGNGSDEPTDPALGRESYIYALNALGDPSLSPSAKKNVFTQLYRDGLLPDAKMTSLFKEADKFSTDIYREGYKKASAVAESLAWDDALSGALTERLTSFYNGAAGLNEGELRNGINVLINDFADDNTDIMGMVNTYQEDKLNFWAGWTSRGAKKGTFVRKNMGSFQQMVERGEMAGLVQQEPEMFVEYAANIGLLFNQAVVNGTVENLDLSNIRSMADGSPEVQATLVDNFGRSLIATRINPITDGTTRAAPPGFGEAEGAIPIRVMQAISEETRTKNNGEVVRSNPNIHKLGFVELTEHEAYYLMLTDADGNQVSGYTPDGDLAVANRIIMGFTGRYTLYGQPIMEEISIDPDFLLRSQRGNRPF